MSIIKSDIIMHVSLLFPIMEIVALLNSIDYSGAMFGVVLVGFVLEVSYCWVRLGSRFSIFISLIES